MAGATFGDISFSGLQPIHRNSLCSFYFIGINFKLKQTKLSLSINYNCSSFFQYGNVCQRFVLLLLADDEVFSSFGAGFSDYQSFSLFYGRVWI
jgi:hypothetical protein